MVVRFQDVHAGNRETARGRCGKTDSDGHYCSGASYLQLIVPEGARHALHAVAGGPQQRRQIMQRVQPLQRVRPDLGRIGRRCIKSSVDMSCLSMNHYGNAASQVHL